MTTRLITLARHQLDRKLKGLRPLKKQARPSGGWIRAIRTSLGLSAAALGAKLGITQSSVAELEASEASETITLKSLKRAAHAMDCEVVYAIVPRSSLEDILRQHADEKARSIVDHVSHSMRLEDQEVSPRETNHEVRALAQSLLDNPRTIWK